jgi:hypothetical protein
MAWICRFYTGPVLPESVVIQLTDVTNRRHRPQKPRFREMCAICSLQGGQSDAPGGNIHRMRAAQQAGVGVHVGLWLFGKERGRLFGCSGASYCVNTLHVLLHGEPVVSTSALAACFYFGGEPPALYIAHNAPKAGLDAPLRVPELARERPSLQVRALRVLLVPGWVGGWGGGGDCLCY